MSTSKKVIRKAVLSALRSVPQGVRDAESAVVCNSVWANVVAPVVSTLEATPPPSYDGCGAAARLCGTGQSTRRCGPTHRVAVLAYLPMYYELSLLPLMHRAWAHNAQQQQQRQAAQSQHMGSTEEATGPSSSSVCIDIYVPHMLSLQQPAVPHQPPPQQTSGGGGGEMMFVHIRDAEDLASAFTPRGKFNILELTSTEEARLLHNVRCHATTYFSEARSVEAADVATDAPPRRQYLCMSSTAATLVPNGMHGEKKREAVLTQETMMATGRLDDNGGGPVDHIVVLTPAAAYDVFGGRLGKGGGFYDNFLRRLRSTQSAATTQRQQLDGNAVVDPVTDAATLAVRFGCNNSRRLHVVGVALSCQVLANDAAVEALLRAQAAPPTPSSTAADCSNHPPQSMPAGLSPCRIVCKGASGSTAAAPVGPPACGGNLDGADFRIPTDAWDEPVDEIITVATRPCSV